MSTDAQRFLDELMWMHLTWSSLLQIAGNPVSIMFHVRLTINPVAMLFLFGLLGTSMLAGVAILLIIVPVNTKMGRKLGAIQEKMLEHNDNRIKVMNEVLHGVRVIKFFGWEESFSKIISLVR